MLLPSIAIALAAGLPAEESALALQTLRTFTVPGGVAHCVEFSPDGSRLASGGERGDIAVWDLGKKQLVWRSKASDHWLGEVAYSPTGRRLAALGRDLTIWKAADGTLLKRLDAGGPHGLSWSSDDSRLAFVTEEGRVAVADTDSWSVIEILPEFTEWPVSSLALSPDGKRLAAGDNVGTVWELDLDTGAARSLDTHRGSGPVRGLAYSQGELVSFSGGGGIWLGARMLHHRGSVFAGTVSPAGDRLAAGGSGGRLTYWSEGGRDSKEIPLGTEASVSCLAFSPDGATLAVGTYDGQLRPWREGEFAPSFFGHPREPTSLAFSPDGRRAAAASRGRHGHGVIVDLETGDQRSLVGALAVAPGRAPGELLLLDKERLVALDAATGKERISWPVKYREPPLLGPDPAGKRCITGGSRARIWDLSTGENTELETWQRVIDAAWRADNEGWAIGTVAGNHGEFGSVEVHDREDRVVFKKEAWGAIVAVAFSPDGKQFVYCRGTSHPFIPSTPRMVVRDTERFEEQKALERNVDWICFLSDTRALTVSGDRLELWDAVSWDPLASANLPEPRRVVLGPARRTLLVATDAVVHVLRLRGWQLK